MSWTTNGAAVRALRERQGLSQQQLAQRITDRGHPVSERYLSKVENGHRHLSESLAALLADLVGVPVEVISIRDAVDRRSWPASRIRLACPDDERLLAEWGDWMALGGAAQRTLQTRHRQVRKFAREHGPLADVERGDVAAYLGGYGHAATRSTVASYLRCFYAWAVDEGHVHDDPMRRMPKLKTPRNQPRPVPAGDLHAALALAEPRERLWLELMAYAGLRTFEVAAHQRRNLWQDGSGTWWLRVPHGKGGHDQQVPLPAWLGEKASTAEDWSITAQTVQRRCGDLLDAVGSASTSHALRHYYATSLLSETQNLRLTQVLMRHADPSTTARYAAVASRDAVAAVAGLGARERAS